MKLIGNFVHPLVMLSSLRAIHVLSFCLLVPMSVCSCYEELEDCFLETRDEREEGKDSKGPPLFLYLHVNNEYVNIKGRHTVMQDLADVQQQ